MSRPTFADLLRAARLRLGLSQEAAALVVSPFLSVRTLQGWERGDPARPFVQDLVLRALDRVP